MTFGFHFDNILIFSKKNYLNENGPRGKNITILTQIFTLILAI